MAKKMAKKSAKKKVKGKKPLPPWLAKKMGKKGDEKEAPKKGKKKGNPFAKEKLTEANDIIAFIAAVSSKNYAEAHKYLTGIIEGKLQDRIAHALNTPLF